MNTEGLEVLRQTLETCAKSYLASEARYDEKGNADMSAWSAGKAQAFALAAEWLAEELAAL